MVTLNLLTCGRILQKPKKCVRLHTLEVCAVDTLDL